MQLCAATKQTEANFVRVIRKKGSIKCKTGKREAVVTRDSIGTCSLRLNFLPLETSGAASCGTMLGKATGQDEAVNDKRNQKPC